MSEQTNSLFKTLDEYLEFVFEWKKFEEECIPGLKKFLFEKHPNLQHCHESFERHIHKLCEHACYEMFEEVWRILLHNRRNQTPYDFPNFEFDKVKEYMKTYLPPKPVTTEDYKDDSYFLRLSEKEKEEFIAEDNIENARRWEYVNGYELGFIKVMQDIFLSQISDFMELEGDWWIAYEYYFRLKAFSFKAKAHRISHVIKRGLTGEWLDKDFRELDKKLVELQQKEWQEKYGVRKAS